METYQRSVQPVLPPKILTMMLQRSLQYYERLKASGTTNNNTTTGGGASVSGMSVSSFDSAALSLPLSHPAMMMMNNNINNNNNNNQQQQQALSFLLDDSETDDAASQVSQSSLPSLSLSLSQSTSSNTASMTMTMSERERGRENRSSASEQRLNILTDASKSLHQQKVKFGNIGSIPTASEKSHLTKRLPPPSKK